MTESSSAQRRPMSKTKEYDVPQFEPILLANIATTDSHTRGVYEASGGYSALKKVLAEMQPPALIELVKSSNLRGRGGAGFPTGLKWTFLPKDHPGPIYMCINADESEPGTFNNRILMEEDPHQVIEGIILSCFATRAKRRTSISAMSIRSAWSGCRLLSTSATPRATWAKTSWAASSRSIFTCIAARQRTSAAKKPA